MYTRDEKSCDSYDIKNRFKASRTTKRKISEQDTTIHKNIPIRLNNNFMSPLKCFCLTNNLYSFVSGKQCHVNVNEKKRDTGR